MEAAVVVGLSAAVVGLSALLFVAESATVVTFRIERYYTKGKLTVVEFRYSNREHNCATN